MKKKITYLLLAILYMANVSAQEIFNYIGISGDFGYTNLILNTPDASNKGGIGGGLSVFYEFQYNSFLARTGFGTDLMSSKRGLTIPQYNASMSEPHPSITYHYNFDNFLEKNHYGTFYIPIMAGMRFAERYYFMAGAKFGINLSGKYQVNSDMTIWGSDTDFIDPIEQRYTHELETFQIGNSGKLRYNSNIMLSGEIGIDLDEWLAVKPRPVRRGRPRKKTFKELLHYRAAIFADYGLSNINAMAKTEGSLLAFNSSNPSNVIPYTMLGAKDYSNNKLNSLLVGVKFAVQYEIPRKVKKPAPKPRPRPQPRPVVKPNPPVPTLKGIIYDIETMEVLSAQVDILNKDGGENLFSGVANADGMFNTKVKPGTYKALVDLAGYMLYEDEITFVSDTLRIGLTRIKEGRTFVLANMFFATNKTTILLESEGALEDLYYFLTENPDMRIKIIGHTDAIGSETANQILSEGRAQAVRQNMIDRGIDSTRIEYEGKGESQPISTNDTEEGRAKNRRVELIIL